MSGLRSTICAVLSTLAALLALTAQAGTGGPILVVGEPSAYNIAWTRDGSLCSSDACTRQVTGSKVSAA